MTVILGKPLDSRANQARDGERNTGGTGGVSDQKKKRSYKRVPLAEGNSKRTVMRRKSRAQNNLVDNAASCH